MQEMQNSGASERLWIVSEVFTEECGSAFTTDRQTQPGYGAVFLLNAFLLVRSDSCQCYWFSAWQGGSLGHAGCNRAHQPLPASLLLGAHLEQMAQQHPHSSSALLHYPHVATIKALPVYLCPAHSSSSLLLCIQFQTKLCPGWDPNPTPQKCSWSCRTACPAGLFPALLGREGKPSPHSQQSWLGYIKPGMWTLLKLKQPKIKSAEKWLKAIFVLTLFISIKDCGDLTLG